MRFAGQEAAANLEKAKIAVTASFHPNTLAHQVKEIGHANASQMGLHLRYLLKSGSRVAPG